MGSIAGLKKPHLVCIPYPAQGHINPMTKLAKLLHSHGFHISFVNTEYNHNRLLRSRGQKSLDGLPDFRYYTIPDGLPPSDADATQDIVALCKHMPEFALPHFCRLVSELNDGANGVPPVTCILSDGVMSWTLKAAEKLGLPEVLFWTTGACGTLGYCHCPSLIDKGYIPLKDTSYVTNGWLETTLDWLPGMKDIKLRDLSSFIRTTDMEDTMLQYLLTVVAAIPKGRALILNTFDALEQEQLDALTAYNPNIYTMGPLHLMLENHVDDPRLEPIGSNLWKEDTTCIDWLDTKPPNSVVYINFGSITVMTKEQLVEFGWGLANSKKDFLWITRPDIVGGDEAMMPMEFSEETKERGRVTSWCPQEQVLNHPAVGGFLTHCGWNSTLESISGGVPMICWPFFAEQQTNCRFSCVEWGIGMEIDSDVKREEVEAMVRELMDGEKGKEMKKNALEWKKKAEEAAAKAGNSYLNLKRLINDVLLPK